MIVIIIGMHRSGTSALAGLLHSNNISMGKDGDFYPPPAKENPKGFYENVRFRRVNDAILALHGYKVKSFSPTIPTVVSASDEINTAMGNLILEYCPLGNWGWKDPRTCLTIYAWLSILERIGKLKKVRIVVIERSYESVARSMRARGNKEQYDLQFVKLASQYQFYFQKGFISFVKEHGEDIPITSINFRELIFDTANTAIKLSDFLEHDITDISFVEEGIAKNVP